MTSESGATSRPIGLRTRLLGGYAVVLATVVIGYGFLLAGVMTLGASPKNIVTNHHTSIQAAERMIQAVQEQQNAILRQLLNSEYELDIGLEHADRQFRDWLAQADASIALLDELAILETIEQRYERLQTLIADRDRWAGLYPWEPDMIDAFRGVIQACRQLAEINVEAMLEVSETAHERVQAAVYSAGIAAFGTLLVSLLVALNVTRRLSAPLQQIVTGSRRIADGDYQVQVPPSSTRELDQLGRQFNAMARALQRFEAMNLERVLREQRQSEAVLQSIDDGLVIIGEDARIRHLNPIAARQLSMDAAACRNHYLGELLDDDAIDTEVRHCLDSADDAGPGFGELRIGHAGGTRFLGYSVLPIIGEREQRQGAVMVIRDITEHKAFEQMRNEFVMRASHELRTPVTGIRMGIGMLAEKLSPTVESRERELFDTVIEELDRLTLLVNELFDLSRLQADRLPLDLQPGRIETLLDAALQRFALSAEERRIELRLDAADDLPDVMIDPERFDRVLDNLISNALRHTGKDGQVQLCAFADGGRVTIEVTDTGCGIEYSRQQRVFEPFVQASDSGGGAGLGLAICREIVHQHDGRIALRSTPGLGTTFRIDLPV